MKFQDLLKDEIDSLADDHIGSSIDNPIRKDAFKVSNTEKIKLILFKLLLIIVMKSIDFLLADKIRLTWQSLHKYGYPELINHKGMLGLLF